MGMSDCARHCTIIIGVRTMSRRFLRTSSEEHAGAKRRVGRAGPGGRDVLGEVLRALDEGALGQAERDDSQHAAVTKMHREINRVARGGVGDPGQRRLAQRDEVRLHVRRHVRLVGARSWRRETLSVPAKNVTPKMSRNGMACEKKRARRSPRQRISPKEKSPSMQVTMMASANQTA